MTDYDKLILRLEVKLDKAITHLDYTYKKIFKLPDEYMTLDEEQLETWESFSARFSRVADIFLTRYIRTRLLREDPGFSGSLRDQLHAAEKLGLIDDTKEWLTIRELRNLIAHEYMEENISNYFRQLKKHTPKLLEIKNLLKENK